MKIQQSYLGNCYFISVIEQIISTFPEVLDNIDVSELTDSLGFKGTYFCFIFNIDGNKVPICCSRQILIRYAGPRKYLVYAHLNRLALNDNKEE